MKTVDEEVVEPWALRGWECRGLGTDPEGGACFQELEAGQGWSARVPKVAGWTAEGLGGQTEASGPPWRGGTSSSLSVFVLVFKDFFNF